MFSCLGQTQFFKSGDHYYAADHCNNSYLKVPFSMSYAHNRLKSTCELFTCTIIELRLTRGQKAWAVNLITKLNSINAPEWALSIRACNNFVFVVLDCVNLHIILNRIIAFSLAHSPAYFTCIYIQTLMFFNIHLKSDFLFFFIHLCEVPNANVKNFINHKLNTSLRFRHSIWVYYIVFCNVYSLCNVCLFNIVSFYSLNIY